MGRIIKNEEKWHGITIRGDQKESLMVFVKGGRRGRPYLAMHAPHGQSFLSISGNKTLRALATTILKVVKR